MNQVTKHGHLTQIWHFDKDIPINIYSVYNKNVRKMVAKSLNVFFSWHTGIVRFWKEKYCQLVYTLNAPVSNYNEFHFEQGLDNSLKKKKKITTPCEFLPILMNNCTLKKDTCFKCLLGLMLAPDLK